MKMDPKDASHDVEGFERFRSASLPPTGAEVAGLDGLRVRLRKDLVVSRASLAWRYLLLSIAGYALSLGVCAQNDFGLTGIGKRVAAALHTLPDPWCPLLCGSIFTGIPFFLCLASFNRFQHRFLLFKMWWFVGVVPLAMSGLMLLLPQQLQHARMTEHLLHAEGSGNSHAWDSTAWILTWLAAAVFLPYVLEAIVYLVLRPRRRKPSKTSAAP